MNKALEILKREYPLICDMSFEWGWKSCEEVMKPKTCALCGYYEQWQGTCFNEKSPLCADFVNSEFGCIYHEPKYNS